MTELPSSPPSPPPGPSLEEISAAVAAALDHRTSAPWIIANALVLRRLRAALPDYPADRLIESLLLNDDEIYLADPTLEGLPRDPVSPTSTAQEGTS